MQELFEEKVKTLSEHVSSQGKIVDGHVETPEDIVVLMIEKLFSGKLPLPNSTILDPGCGEGAFIQGIIQWCTTKKLPIPKIVGAEINPQYASIAKTRFKNYPSVIIEEGDFLLSDGRKFDYVIGNPPYVPITKLTETQKRRYRPLYGTATNRFDLYMLFFEKVLHNLKQTGRLVLITPEKFLYVETCRPLRKLLSDFDVIELHFINEDAFGELVTYPIITTVNEGRYLQTKVVNRDSSEITVKLPSDGTSWLPYLQNEKVEDSLHVLSDICIRISAGVATGADEIFVKKTTDVAQSLKQFAYPTIAGRDLDLSNGYLVSEFSMLVPYSKDGKLLRPDKLSRLIEYLSQRNLRERLEKRTCVAHKPWYAFHENPPMRELLKPKILCKDITSSPRFWVDSEGIYVPRHSVYYIIPANPKRIREIADFLNSSTVRKWLENHCQRAANSFIRIQSHVLKQLPIPDDMAL